ncbi:UNVERIFIED_CONTAM: hypothetical protein Slati_1695200 [Sesamum latifolium]|uniref:Uncharacterized protein n=1 Tax=Sesamum latifolium TaxID=2727402 RepID=A0AAW2WW63_9LAMI
MGGDSQDEKTGAPQHQCQIEEFRCCLADCQLVDLGCLGHPFTWCNHREAPNTVRVRLDRACATLGWQNMFPNSRVTSEVPRGLGHSLLIIDLDAARDSHPTQHRKLFRFEAMWTRSAECDTLIHEFWNHKPTSDAGSRLGACTRQVRKGLIG